MIDSARLAAFNAFDEVVRKKAYSNLTIKQAVSELSDKDRAFAGALFYGTLEKLLTLDFILDNYIKSNPKPIIRNILRIGVYQIYFMGVPDRAAVDTSSELAKKLGKQGASGFINGVLRNAARGKDTFEVPESLGRIKYLSVKYSFAEWMIKMWDKQLGKEECEKLVSYEKDNLFSLYPNSLKGTDESVLIEEFEKHGVEYKKSEIAEGMYKVGGTVFETDLFKRGKVAVQGEASQLAASVAVENNPETVLDICAAPGGKTAAMAHMNHEAKYTACDVSENRVDIMRKQFKRLGVTAHTLIKDASEDTSELGLYDTVLVDAPCSALGTVFTHPEVRYNKTYEDITKIIPVQKAIIENAAKNVKTGGRLVYATCTVNTSENHDVVGGFLDAHSEFKAVFPKTFYGIINDNRFDGNGTALLPHKDNTTGFYIACLEKIDG